MIGTPPLGRTSSICSTGYKPALQLRDSVKERKQPLHRIWDNPPGCNPRPRFDPKYNRAIDIAQGLF
jgi:hypothetical protein